MTKHTSSLRSVVAVRRSTGSKTADLFSSLRSLTFTGVPFPLPSDLFISVDRKFHFVTVYDTCLNILYLFPYDFLVKYYSLKFQSISKN